MTDRVLIWHDNDGLTVYDATDEAKAYLRMFCDMDARDYWYSISKPAAEGTNPPTTPEIRLRRLYSRAKAGDGRAARELCATAARDGWEYQYNDLHVVTKP